MGKWLLVGFYVITRRETDYDDIWFKHFFVYWCSYLLFLYFRLSFLVPPWRSKYVTLIKATFAKADPDPWKGELWIVAAYIILKEICFSFYSVLDSSFPMYCYIYFISFHVRKVLRLYEIKSLKFYYFLFVMFCFYIG